VQGCARAGEFPWIATRHPSRVPTDDAHDKRAAFELSNPGLMGPFVVSRRKIKRIDLAASHAGQAGGFPQ
jgi:hypothetical protein